MADCNRCSLERIKARAKKEGKIVITGPGADFGLGYGTNVWVVPKGTKKSDIKDDTTYKSCAWFMALPNRCEC